MDSCESKVQESLKMKWQGRRESVSEKSAITATPNFHSMLLGFDDNLAATIVPPVTVVLEGRSICHRISLDKHISYQSLAKALRQIFVDDVTIDNEVTTLDLSNAVPGYLIAYEDLENDLLLVGDLNWKDFVRVAKRIRILPVKAKSRKAKTPS